MSDLDDLTAAVNELTRSRINRQPYQAREDGQWIQKVHKTDVACLLDQLTDALEPGGTGEAGRSVPASRPSARIEASDTLLRIDQQTYDWCKTWATDRRWDSIPDKLRALVGAGTKMHPDDLHDLTRAARSWATAARVTTGWEVPARRLRSTCPLCAASGTLRVRVGDGIHSASASALCVNCFETWDDNNIGLLAEHIRAENGDDPLYGEAS